MLYIYVSIRDEHCAAPRIIMFNREARREKIDNAATCREDSTDTTCVLVELHEMMVMPCRRNSVFHKQRSDTITGISADL